MRTNWNNLLSGMPLVTSIIIFVGLVRLADVARADCVPPPPGLVAWWPGDDNANDIIGGNNGTLTNGAAFATGAVGQAFSFNTNHAGVLACNTTNLQLQDFTIEAWIQRGSTAFATDDPTAVDESALLFGYGSQGYALGMEGRLFGGSGVLFLTKVDVDGVSAGPAITDTNLHHVAVTKSGTSVVFYIDGSAYPVAAPYSETFQFTTPAAIGVRSDRLNGNNNGSFFGTIDEVSIYNRALFSNEVAAIYTAGSAGKCPASACASLAIDFYAGLSLQGTVGAANRLEYVSNLGDTNWTTLANIILPQSPYLVFDPDSPRWARRFYRVQCAAAAGLVALGDALFDGTSDQFPTNSYRPLPAGVRTYQGYGSLAGYSLTETISYGESVAAVPAVRVHFASTLPGDQGNDFWYARDVHGDMRYLKSMSGSVVVWVASTTVTPTLALPQNPVPHQCWSSYADADDSVRGLDAAVQGFSGLLKLRVVGDDDSIQYNFYKLGVGRVVIQTSKDPSPTGSGWKIP